MRTLSSLLTLKWLHELVESGEMARTCAIHEHKLSTYFGVLSFLLGRTGNSFVWKGDGGLAPAIIFGRTSELAPLAANVRIIKRTPYSFMVRHSFELFLAKKYGELVNGHLPVDGS